MSNKTLTSEDYRIFFIKTLVWIIGLGFVGFIMTLGGFFYGWISALYIACSAVILAPKMLRKSVISAISKEFLIVSLVCVILAVTLSAFAEPTVFSGRDQGAISEAATRLAENHQIAFSTPASKTFFEIYGPGKALNFPGFHYAKNGDLVTQFPLGYISFLATFYAWFGTTGFVIANTLLLILFLIAFYLLLRQFISWKFSAIGILLIASSFPIVWFFKFTLSETMALALLWTAILSTIRMMEKPQALTHATLLGTVGLLVFTRIEGWAFLGIIGTTLAMNPSAKAFFKKDLKNRIFIPLAIFLVLAIANFVVDWPFFKEIGKAVIKPLLEHESATSGALASSVLIKIFALYGMLGFFIVSIPGILAIAKKRDISALIPLFVISPTLVYFINANISADHPWMLRRFIFSLFPAAVLYSTLFIANQYQRKTKFLLFGITLLLFSSSIVITAPLARHRENATLLDQGRQLTKQFTPKDLILMSPNATGDHWSMLAGPLSSLDGMNTVYFFNPNDFFKINKENYDHIYLITSDEDEALYTPTLSDKMQQIKTFTISTSQIASNDSSQYSLPKSTAQITPGKIFKLQ